MLCSASLLRSFTKNPLRNVLFPQVHANNNNNNKRLFGLLQLYAKMSSSARLQLKEIEGDLFSAPKDFSLAHCVAADFHMGAGIAVKFKQLYGRVDELLSQNIRTGGVAVLKDKERFIYYLVTKAATSDRPTYDSLRSSLTAMREHMNSNNVNKVAMPRIGCGIDGLEWDKVRAELGGVFGNSDFEIVVYNFVPK